MRIITQTPTRIGLIGGGTDVNPFANIHGGKILSFAINLYHRVTLEPIKDRKILLYALDQKKEINLDQAIIYHQDNNFDLLYAIINNFKPFIKTGFKLNISFNGKGCSGLGGSGSAAVATIGAFNQWLKRGLTRMEIAFLAWRMEVKELGWMSGKQDQLAAAFGGVNLLTFGAKDSAGVIPLKFSESIISKIKKWTLLFYVGGRRHSANLQKKLSAGMTQEEKQKALIGLKKGVGKIIIALKNKDFYLVGKILDEAWEYKKRSNPSIINSHINDIYSLAKKNGACGGKIMGAGAGGHMFFFCPPEKQDKLIKALSLQKIQEMDFDFDFEGLKVKTQK